MVYPTAAAYIAVNYWPLGLFVLFCYLPTVSLIYSRTTFQPNEIYKAVKICTGKPLLGLFLLPWMISMIFPVAVSYIFIHSSSSVLKQMRFYWNLSIAFFSFLGFVYAIGDLIVHNNMDRIIDLEFEHSEYTYVLSGVMGIFSLTKSIEFMDTFFLVSSGKKPSFLHVYHHFTVALYCWIGEIFSIPYGHIFAFMNLFVHACMYCYFAFVPKYKCIRIIRPGLTILQIIQMIVGTAIAVNVSITNQDFIAYITLAMYASYLVLFLNFFFKQYIKF